MTVRLSFFLVHRTLKGTTVFQKVTTLALVLSSGLVAAQTITVPTSRSLGSVSPTLYGLMTEEINYSYDGGLYAEMLGNRMFTRDEQRSEWTVVTKGTSGASLEYEKTGGPSSALPRYAKLVIEAASKDREAGIANSGYWGMKVEPAEGSALVQGLG